jgi:hypothetical protein
MRARDVALALAATAAGAAAIALLSPPTVEAPPPAAVPSPAPPPGPDPVAPERHAPAPAAPVSGRFGDWRYVVVHHTGEASGDLATLDAKHRSVLGYEDGLAFHFLVGNGSGLALGAVAEGDRFRRGIPGPHCTENPAVSLASVGVAAIGDTGAAPLPGEQRRALAALVESLRRRFAIPLERVLLHREVEGGDPLCPGSHFDAAAFRAEMAAMADTELSEDRSR